MSNFTDIQQFARVFDVASAWKDNHRADVAVLTLRQNLIVEEVRDELLPALHDLANSSTLENLTPLADAIVDSVYVLLGLAVALDLPWEELWNEVHRSNMAKVHADGSVRRRDDGKILKPSDWHPPNLYSILIAWQQRRLHEDRLRY